MAEGTPKSPHGILLHLSEVLSENAINLRSMALQSSNSSSSTSRSTSTLVSSSHGTSSEGMECTELLARADRIRKKLKPYNSKRLKMGDDDGDSSVCLVSVCVMAATKKGLYTRGSNPYIEMEASRNDSYETFALKAARKCNLTNEDGCRITLFKSNGSMILDEGITIKGKEKPWTFGRYLQLLKKAPQNTKIGVGLVDLEDSDVSNEEHDLNEERYSNVSTWQYTNKDFSVDDDSRYSPSQPPSKKVKRVIISSSSEESSKSTYISKVEASNDTGTKTNDMMPLESKGTAEFFSKHSSIGLKLNESDLKTATNNFESNRKLGEGGFGTVYKGYFRGTFVAIKLFTKEDQKELHAVHPSLTNLGQLSVEMDILTQYRHNNLVEMMGFCDSPLAIVYEFMEGGSLFHALHNKKKHKPLSWNTRAMILKGVCKGMAWLHSATSPPLIHGDIKSANVLLDRHMNAKLGDFGLARRMPRPINEGRSMITTIHTVKSPGYNAPELDFHCHSPKTDIYSYGIVVLETFTGLLAFCKERQDHTLIEHLQGIYTTLDGLNSVTDPCLKDCDEPAPYLVNIFFNIINDCVVKHSMRATSDKIMAMWEETNF